MGDDSIPRQKIRIFLVVLVSATVCTRRKGSRHEGVKKVHLFSCCTVLSLMFCGFGPSEPPSSSAVQSTKSTEAAGWAMRFFTKYSSFFCAALTMSTRWGHALTRCPGSSQLKHPMSFSGSKADPGMASGMQTAVQVHVLSHIPPLSHELNARGVNRT